MLQTQGGAQELLAKPNLTHTAQNAANQYHSKAALATKLSPYQESSGGNRE